MSRRPAWCTYGTCPTTGPPGAASHRGSARLHSQSSQRKSKRRWCVRYGYRRKIIIPLPQGATGDRDTLRSDLQNHDYQIAFPTTTAAGGGAGRSSAPLRDWGVTRLKSEPDESLVGLCKDVPGQIGVLYGIPNVLTSGSGSETQTREAFRRFVLTAIEPLALIVARELQRVFEQPVELDLSQLAHADIAGRARAFKALVASGMPAADAALFAGVEV